jgi:hypothetical protein
MSSRTAGETGRGDRFRVEDAPGIVLRERVGTICPFLWIAGRLMLAVALFPEFFNPEATLCVRASSLLLFSFDENSPIRL